MLKKRKKDPLLKCNVRHALDGRIRIGCRAVKYLADCNEAIINRITGLAGVSRAGISNITQSILIHYDPRLLDRIELIEAVEGILSAYAFHAHRAERAEAGRLAVQERVPAAESIPAMVKQLGVTASVLLLSAIRRGRPLVIAPGLGRLSGLQDMATLALSVPIFRSGFRSIRTSLRPNADTLSAAAIITSILTGQSGSALAVIFLHHIAELLTAFTMDRTKKAIRDMLASDTDTLWRLSPDGTLEKINVTAARKGDRIVAHAGEKIGVDGKVEEGTALVDQSAITGEFMPIEKKRGDPVFAGTTVKEGTLTITATKVGKETALLQIVRMVESATENKAPVQNYADRFSSSLLFLNLALFGVVYAATRNIQRALSMLVIDYSCGIRLSTAAALAAAINTAARNGVFIKGSGYIETLSEADTLVLDKTGTITRGRPEVVSIHTLNETVSPEELLRQASAAEETSTHPMAAAILAKSRGQGVRIPKHGEINILAGKGVQTKVGRNVVRVGNKTFMNENGLHTHPFRNKVSGMALAGESIVYVARGRKVIGVIGVSDPLRDRMKKSLNRLRLLGIDDIVMLTGDLEQHAAVVADRMSLDRFESEQLPEDKARTVVQIQSEGAKVVMVGDGINDAAALAYADVGIALGQSRTDIAIEAADVTISGDNPMMLPALFKLSNDTLRVIKQNFATAIGINTVALVFGGIGVLPVFWGAVLHNSSTILVIANSMRLLFYEM